MRTWTVMLMIAGVGWGCSDSAGSDEGEDVDAPSNSDPADVEADVAREPDTVDVSDEPDSVEVPPDAPSDPVADAPTTDASDTPIDAEVPGPDLSQDPDAEPDPDVADAETGPWFELGIGESEFAPVIDFQDAAMAQGIQGGFHVWGAFRGAGFEPRDVIYEATLTTDDGELVGAVFWQRDVEENDTGVLEATGITVFLAPLVPEIEDGSVWEYCGTILTTDGFTDTQCAPITARCCEYLDW